MLFTIAAALAASVAGAQAAPAAALDFSSSATWPGVWSYRALPGASEAVFLDTAGSQRIAFRCTRSVRQVTLSHATLAPAATLTVWTSTQQRTLPARFVPAERRVSVELAGTDTLLDAIAYSRGRIGFVMPGSAPLIIKPGPEAARVFEDCRN